MTSGSIDCVQQKTFSKSKQERRTYTMELGNQIKQYRTIQNLSQEELADQVYVTRQTISNWETGKSCPDIHSLLLLSSVFQISLDQLIKGDLKEMKETINEYELKNWNKRGGIFAVLFTTSILSFVPLLIFGKIYGLILWILLYAVTMGYAIKIEQFKKKHDIHTLKEILAFNEGKRLDEIEKRVEAGKRPYQIFLSMLISGCIGFAVAALSFWLFKNFL